MIGSEGANMKKAKRIERAVLIGLGLTLTPLLLAAQCKDASGTVVFQDPVISDVVLTSDVECLAIDGSITSAITVAQEGITIDLGGHTLSCISNVDLRSDCQSAGVVGINVGSISNVTVKGIVTTTGKGIKDFGIGVLIGGANKGTVKNLVISGPNLNASDRGSATGIKITGVSCPGAILIEGNEIYNHRYGILVESSSCVKIQGNDIHDNKAAGGSYGIGLLNSGGNTVANNQIDDNGLSSGLLDGGLVLNEVNPSTIRTTGNRVAQNSVQRNCGDGISTRGTAQGNPISGTFARQNPPDAGNNICEPKPVGSTASDLAERNFPGANAWRKNNDCETGFQIPAGVCTTP